MVGRLAVALLAALWGVPAHNQPTIAPPTMAEMVLPQGYPLEEHEVETEDGYLLTVYRIPYGRRGGAAGPPLLLQHGILCSSACWVLSTPDKGLGFVLADAGYDVWMGNSRGNTYSKKHNTFNPETDKAKYWNFSFHEMGYYDIPATIDYILKRTNNEKLHYVAHSQGTTMFFAMGAARPEYNKKIKVMSGLGPIAFLDHTRGAVRLLTFLSSLLEKGAKLLNMYEVLSDNLVIHLVERTVCRRTALTRPLCDNLLFLIAGYDSQQLNITLVPIIAEHCPAGASVKQLEHFAQLANNGEKFTMFDYGMEKNLIHYHQPSPPEYDLGKVSVPVILHYGENDWLAGLKDVRKLSECLPNSTMVPVKYHYFNHLDFMWATDVKQLLYDDLINIIRKY